MVVDNINLVDMSTIPDSIILERLQLKNFGVHDELDLEFNSPISLVVGGNGVGKTTIADAISLTLGGHSDRYNLKDIRGYIGTNGKHAVAKVYLKNKKNKNNRYPLISDFTGVPIRKTLKIEMRIGEQETTWYINNEKKTRSKLRELLAQGDVIIDMNNDLYYTKKTSIDEFMGGNANSKFRMLISPLQLDEIKQRIQELQYRTQQYISSLPQLKFRKKQLSHELTIAKDKKTAYQEKQKLIKELFKLKQDYQWVSYFELEDTRKIKGSKKAELDRKLERIYLDSEEMVKKLDSIANNIHQTNAKISIMEKKKDNIKLKYNQYQTKIMVLNNQKNIKISEITVNKDVLNEHKSELKSINDSYFEKIQHNELMEMGEYNVTNSDFQEKLSNAKTELNKLYKEHRRAEQSISKISAEITSLQDKEVKLQEALENESDYKITPGNLFSHDEKTAKKLRNILDRESWGKQVSNPLFQEIYLNDKSTNYEKAINYALGGIKSYMLYEPENVNQLRKTMESKKISLWVAPYPTGKLKPPKQPSIPEHLQKYVIGTLADFIEINNKRVATYIYNKVNVIIASESASAMQLLELARVTKMDVITATPSVFKPDSRFRTHVHSSMSLGKKTDNMKRISEIMTSIDSVNNRIQEERNKRETIRNEKDIISHSMNKAQQVVNEVNEEYTQLLEKNPQYFTSQIQKQEASILYRQNTITLLKKELKKIQDALQLIKNEDYQKQIQSLSEMLDTSKKKRNELRRQEDILKIDEEEQISLIKYTENEKLMVKYSIREIDTKLTSIQKRLFSKKPRSIPDKVHLLKMITQKETLMNAIQASKEDLDTYEALNHRYKETGSDLVKIKKLLEENKIILIEEEEKWQDLISSEIQEIQDVSNILLSPFIETKIETLNSIEVENIELSVTFKRIDGDETQYNHYKFASGGEMALITQALFLSLHTRQKHSPIHIIDEFSQRLDEKFRSHALIMVQRLLNILIKKDDLIHNVTPQLILIAPLISGSYIPEYIDTTYLVKVKTIRQRVRNNKEE